MKFTKKLTNFLGAFLLLLTLCLIPSPGETQAAAKTAIGWWTEIGSTPKVQTSRTIQIEAGQKFYLGYYFISQKMTDMGPVGSNGNDLNLTYTSSKPSVAAVGKKTGYVITKKAGTTKITVTYKKKKYYCTLKVSKKGALGMTTTFKKLNSAANALAKEEKTRVTSGNIVSLCKKYANYWNQRALIKKELNYGFLGSSNKLVIPSEESAEYTCGNITSYIYAHDPAFAFKITRASGKAGSGSISVQLNKKPAIQQIYMLQIAPVFDTEQRINLSSTRATIDIIQVSCIGYVGDDESNEDTWSFTSSNYQGICTIKRGSTSASISHLQDDDGNPVTLKKDYEYRVSFNDKEVTFVAK
ncbi:MAG: hypothetical protein SOZ59_12835 [Candidatus Limivivens sp.]|nr:hypothetical protein [Candidatus Limivivens sp.]